jgi:hypothetical protein
MRPAIRMSSMEINDAVEAGAGFVLREAAYQGFRFK